jgi:beta-glucanase (GH16 family)
MLRLATAGPLRRCCVVAGGIAVASIAAAFMAGCGGGATTPRVNPPDSAPVAQADSLIFDDEFSGSSLDRTKWSVYTGEVFNSEAEAYTDDASTLYIAHGADAAGSTDGALVIQGRYRPDTVVAGRHVDFTSARIHSKWLFHYGTAAARIKLPAGAGLWPAFWLLGVSAWPAAGEIDVMENVGDPAWVSTAVHGPNYSGNTPFAYRFMLPGTLDVTEWHIYSAIWSVESIDFAVDGIPSYRVSRDDIARYGPPAAALDSLKFLVLNLALGGQYPAAVNNVRTPYLGLPDATVGAIQNDRAKMFVDWVRVTRR